MAPHGPHVAPLDRPRQRLRNAHRADVRERPFGQLQDRGRGLPARHPGRVEEPQRGIERRDHVVRREDRPGVVKGLAVAPHAERHAADQPHEFFQDRERFRVAVDRAGRPREEVRRPRWVGEAAQRMEGPGGPQRPQGVRPERRAGVRGHSPARHPERPHDGGDLPVRHREDRQRGPPQRRSRASRADEGRRLAGVRRGAAHDRPDLDSRPARQEPERAPGPARPDNRQLHASHRLKKNLRLRRQDEVNRTYIFRAGASPRLNGFRASRLSHVAARHAPSPRKSGACLMGVSPGLIQ